MSEFLYHYHPVEPTTWVYLSSLLMIGLFFKFSRLWSVRNLDLLLLILLSPGLLFVYYGEQMTLEAARRMALTQQASESASTTAPLVESAELPPPDQPPGAAQATEAELPRETTSPMVSADLGRRGQLFGYLWLFCVGALLLARLLADPTMVRRPLLDPNLSAGGLSFIGCSLFVFLMANVINKVPEAETPTDPSVSTVSKLNATVGASAAGRGPGHALLNKLPRATTKPVVIVSHLAIVVGMVLIGYWHFENIVMGIGAATLYLMLPYTAIMTGRFDHALPAALLVWAVLWYRSPLTAGLFIGSASGILYYPLFLLPLWISFYWHRGLLRFLSGVGLMLVLLVFALVPFDDVLFDFRRMFGLMSPAMKDLGGIWNQSVGGWNSYYRLPVLAAFVALCGSMALWPAQKNLGTLLSCSAAIMVSAQFWHGYGGGTYMAWYLPLLLLTIFRPNLEDRVALTVLTQGWLPRRLTSTRPSKAA